MRGSWKAGGTAVFSTLVSVALAYQLPAVVELDLGRSFPSALAIENFHDTEQGYRWTRAESCLGAQLAISVHNCPVLTDSRFPMSIFKRTQQTHSAEVCEEGLSREELA